MDWGRSRFRPAPGRLPIRLSIAALSLTALTMPPALRLVSAIHRATPIGPIPSTVMALALPALTALLPIASRVGHSLILVSLLSHPVSCNRPNTDRSDSRTLQLMS